VGLVSKLVLSLDNNVDGISNRCTLWKVGKFEHVGSPYMHENEAGTLNVLGKGALPAMTGMLAT
jgi:hypothetical protein